MVIQSSDGGLGNSSRSSRSSTVTASGRTRGSTPLTPERASLVPELEGRSTIVFGCPYSDRDGLKATVGRCKSSSSFANRCETSDSSGNCLVSCVAERASRALT